MIKDFKKWIKEIEVEALAEKHSKAQKKGDVSQWRKEIWKSPEKNKAIKRRFRDEGFKLGYKSRPSYISGAGEWLYDFVWREFDAEDNLVRVVLTMEIEVSEMNEKGIKYDFNKLLQADSDFKILVFQLKTESDVKAALSTFSNAAKCYKAKSNSEFLLCGWCTSLNQFIFENFNVVA